MSQQYASAGGAPGSEQNTGLMAAMLEAMRQANDTDSSTVGVDGTSTTPSTSDNPLGKLLEMFEQAKIGVEASLDEEFEEAGSDRPNLLSMDDLSLTPLHMQASLSLDESLKSNEVDLKEEAFFLDEVELEEVKDETWHKGLPTEELTRLGLSEASLLDEEEGIEGKDRGDGEEEGGRHRRRGCRTGYRWRRRYRARRRAYLSNDPWIQRHAYWRPVGNTGRAYGLSPVECRVGSKVLALLLDHGSVANNNGCCCKTNSLLERILMYVSDTLLGNLQQVNLLSFFLRLAACPAPPENSSTELDLFVVRLLKRIACANIDLAPDAKNNGAVPSTAALISEFNELLIYAQKNTGKDLSTIAQALAGVVFGTSTISAAAACRPDNVPFSDPLSFQGLKLCCLGPCGCYELNFFDALAPFLKTLITYEVAPDPCLDRLCARIKKLVVTLFQLCPINKCKLRAFKYRDCCGNVRTLCAPQPPDFLTILLQIEFCPCLQLDVNGFTGPINILGNDLLRFVLGILKRLITYTPPPRLGCTFKGPCHATDMQCCSDPLCQSTSCGNSCGQGGPCPSPISPFGNKANTCCRDANSVFGSMGFWSARERQRFEEQQKEETKEEEEEEEATISSSARGQKDSTFEAFAARLRAAILERNGLSDGDGNEGSRKRKAWNLWGRGTNKDEKVGEQEGKDREKDQGEGEDASSRTKKQEEEAVRTAAKESERESKYGEDTSSSDLPSFATSPSTSSRPKRRRSPLPSRPMPLPKPSQVLPAPKNVTIDDLPREVDMRHLTKYVQILSDSLKQMGLNEDAETMAVLGGMVNQLKKLSQITSNGIVNPDRKALGDCVNNPVATAFCQLLQPTIPLVHALICVEEVRALDFIIQPLKQILVEVCFVGVEEL